MMTHVKMAPSHSKNTAIQETIQWDKPPQEPSNLDAATAALLDAQMSQINVRLLRSEHTEIKLRASLVGKTITDYLLDSALPDRIRVDKRGISQ